MSLVELSLNPLASETKESSIKRAALPPEIFAPLDHPAPEHHAEARIPENIELSPTASPNLFWDESTFDQIVKATNAYALEKRAACAADAAG